VAKQFIQWGYVTLRIDFRGCGERYARLKKCSKQ
jgi:alpha/beta superfamily hydrolase